MGILAGWRYCPRCATELAGRVRTTSSARRAAGSTGPKSVPGVQGILERDGRVLLARRGREPRQGYWDLPGGFLHEGETPEDGLRREFLEETGLEIEPVALLRIDIEPYDERYVFSVSWLVRDVDPAREPRAADDVDRGALVRPRRAARPRWRSPVRIGVLREWAGRSAEPSR